MQDGTGNRHKKTYKLQGVVHIKEILVGQKVRLKAEVIPKSYESREGKWSIEGEKIADYLVLPSVNNPQTGEPKELTEDQYNKPEINCEEFGDGMHSCKNL